MGTFCVWTKFDEWKAGMLDAELYQLFYGINLFFLKISKHFLRAHFMINQTYPFKEQLSLLGYAQISVPGELSL